MSAEVAKERRVSIWVNGDRGFTCSGRWINNTLQVNLEDIDFVFCFRGGQHSESARRAIEKAIRAGTHTFEYAGHSRRYVSWEFVDSARTEQPMSNESNGRYGVWIDQAAGKWLCHCVNQREGREVAWSENLRITDWCGMCRTDRPGLEGPERDADEAGADAYYSAGIALLREWAESDPCINVGHTGEVACRCCELRTPAKAKPQHRDSCRWIRTRKHLGMSV